VQQRAIVTSIRSNTLCQYAPIQYYNTRRIGAYWHYI